MPAGDLTGHGLRARHARVLTRGETTRQAEDLAPAFRERLIGGQRGRIGNLIEWNAGFFGEGDEPAHRVVGVTERHALADEPIGEVGGEEGRI